MLSLLYYKLESTLAVLIVVVEVVAVIIRRKKKSYATIYNLTLVVRCLASDAFSVKRKKKSSFSPNKLYFQEQPRVNINIPSYDATMRKKDICPTS